MAGRPSMSAPVLTLHEVADELGVHYMTVYRYVRLGQLPAEKPAGTWQVTRAALEAFRAGEGVAAVPGRRKGAPWSQRLEARLVAGDGPGAWNVIEAAMAAGADLRVVYLEIVAPAMVRIGERWATGELDVADEHRASALVLRLIGRLGPRFTRRGRTRGGVVLAAPAGEDHGLPVALLGDLLRLERWEVSDLGPNTPSTSLAHAVRSMTHLVATGLSVTTEAGLASIPEAILAVRAADPEALVVLGGSAVEGEEHAVGLGADGYAAGVDDFNARCELHLRAG